MEFTGFAHRKFPALQTDSVAGALPFRGSIGQEKIKIETERSQNCIKKQVTGPYPPGKAHGQTTGSTDHILPVNTASQIRFPEPLHKNIP